MEKQEAQPTDSKAGFALVELTPGTVALCLRKGGDTFYVLKEDMDPTEGVKLLIGVLSGKTAIIDELTVDDWREVDLSQEQWKSREQMALPPFKDWPK